MRKVTAFVPAHISGFFQPCSANTPERAGSRNCGLCLNLGVLTELTIEPADRTNVRVSIDGRHAPEAKTTLAAVDRIIHAAHRKFDVGINHSCQVPIGAGYGASGAGALGAVLAVSKALGSRVPRERLATMAHAAEVMCGTGLGDVGAQNIGGFVIGLRPGGPPYGRWKQVPVPRDLKVVCATLGPLSTKKLLDDADFKQRAGKLGQLAVRKLIKKPTLDGFMLASREFAEGLGLLDGELRTLIHAAEAAGAIGASQIMLGRSVFALTRGPTAERVKSSFSSMLAPGQVMVLGVDPKGARFMNVH